MSQMGLEGVVNGEVERIDPKTAPAGIMAIHLVRYFFAKDYCAGKTVLDIACGAGYGTAELAPVAKEVIGGDIDDGAIAYARANYKADNLEFKKLDAQDISLPDKQFDTVVSFETIEHLPDIEAYLRQISRVLVNDGYFIVSTPRVKRTTRRPNNPHHMIEFSEGDFKNLLYRFFKKVELYGQSRVQTRAHYWLQKLDVLGVRHLVPNSFRKKVNNQLGTETFEDMGVGDQQIIKDKLKRADYMIAVCKSKV